MKILSMTATFGKLNNETMVLQGGLNVLTAPNEWGKSTWCAFLVAMLYGIDTRERTSKDQLADKEKYLPWSGRPMEGSIRLIHQGRDITIQRRTRGKIPMGDFLAYETQSGLPIRELTADNCGLTLLGVEKSVFLRTGFLRFSDLPVKADDTLRRRLNALVTTGDESGSADLLGSKLRELKNRCRHNHTGLIPECQAQIRDTQQKLWEVQRLQQQHDALQDQISAHRIRLQELECHRRHLDWEDAQSDRQRINDARTALRTATLFERALLDKYTNNPNRASVEAKIRQGQELLDALDEHSEEPKTSSFGTVFTAVLAVVMLLAALLLTDHGLWIPCLVLSIILALTSVELRSRQRRKLLWHSVEQSRRKGKREELVKFLESWEAQLRVLDEVDRARENVQRTRTHLQDLQAMARSAEAPEDPDSLTLTREETMQELGRHSAALDHARMERALLRGKMDQLPDEEQLQRTLTQARHRLAELEKTMQAIGYAQNALESAMQELQRRFAPRITQRAGQFLSRLTDGAYDRITIGEDLTVLAARDDESTLRTAAWRSEGTGDQMYLALRLAVWEVLSPNAPLILDDALIRFDQKRMEKALDLLRDLSRNRQILLFTCQEREREYLQK